MRVQSRRQPYCPGRPLDLAFLILIRSPPYCLEWPLDPAILILTSAPPYCRERPLDPAFLIVIPPLPNLSQIVCIFKIFRKSSTALRFAQIACENAWRK